ncbi:MAG TPA: UDP-N-acetylglucosamine--LPS N-acetylglucosamine transferase [Verrucomicrobiae bacterium]|nr:UDP-N-acetylglucosamine--LPS N-acetylglucosamine transferase [Verrucomicrobiae bacterium]
MTSSTGQTKVLAVASGGGHWVQLQRLAPAFVDADVAYVSITEAYRPQVAPHRFYCINDATRWNKARLVQAALQLVPIIAKEKPDVVISTGAAPGYLAICLGKLFGARTVWLDSLANVEHLSLSGRLVRPFADLWLTQWSHLGKPDGPLFRGSVV